ncbi:MAG TPA: PEP-CTERM sorting domain-containing protein [Candidatus Sulfopaludibacter sp.]|jgi:hypothetical protein|nr:PEP-CTERM sorting domain-containing protein [Candidatus Sulfopaludibacter sp.]
MSRADTITYSGILDEPATNGSPVNVTFAAFPGGPSFTLAAGTGDLDNYASVGGASLLFAEGGGSNPSDPQAFGFGSLISAANATAANGLLLRYGLTGESTAGFKGGNWPQNGNSAYLGFSFTASSQTYTGWAQISADVSGPPGSGSAELIDYAYEAGTSIDAGQGTAPEPSSLALFAIGGTAALALLRRRRAASQAS